MSNRPGKSGFSAMLNAFCNGYQPAGEIGRPAAPPPQTKKTAFDQPCKHDYDFLNRSGGAYTFYCRRCLDIQTREF